MINIASILGLFSILCITTKSEFKINERSSFNDINIDTIDDHNDIYNSIFDTHTISKEDNKDNTSHNFILIIGDDLGIELLQMYSQEMQGQGRDNYGNTPILDNLASNGIRFTRAYSYPHCSSTRATILTGRYGFRTSITYPINDRVCTCGLEFPQPTIPLSLSEKVRKAAFGKWHLDSETNGFPSISHPLEAGFEYYDGFLTGKIESDDPLGYVNWTRCNNEFPDCFQEDGYFTSVITDAAINWLQKIQHEQFFLWMAHVAPHRPPHLPPVDLITDMLPYTCNSELPPEKAVYCAMASLEAMDTEIGRLLNSLSDEVKNKTVILFLGDNGTDSVFSDAKPFTPDQTKGCVQEGGIRIPFFISGNDVLAKNTTYDVLVSTVDIFATVLDIMDGTPNLNVTIDSKSLVPFMDNSRDSHHDFVFSEIKGPARFCDAVEFESLFNNSDAIIGDIFKLITFISFDDNEVEKIEFERFFDLNQDPFEHNDLLMFGEEYLSQLELGNLTLLREKRLELLNL